MADVANHPKSGGLFRTCRAFAMGYLYVVGDCKSWLSNELAFLAKYKNISNISL